MAEPPTPVDVIRRQLAENRARVARTTAGLGAALDVPSRLRRTVSAHPIKWALLAAVGGVVVVRAVPLIAGLVRSAGSRRLLGSVAGSLAPLALRVGLKALATHRPDLAAVFGSGHAPDTGDEPSSAADEQGHPR